VESGAPGAPAQGQPHADIEDDNRGNIAPPGEQYYRDLTQAQREEADRNHSPDVHDHAHVAAPVEPRPEYHEPASAAGHDDRTMPNPYRIPEAIPRHEPAPENHGGGDGGGDAPPRDDNHE